MDVTAFIALLGNAQSHPTLVTTIVTSVVIVVALYNLVNKALDNADRIQALQDIIDTEKRAREHNSQELSKVRDDFSKATEQLRIAHGDNIKLLTQLQDSHKKYVEVSAQLEQALQDNKSLQAKLDIAQKSIGVLQQSVDNLSMRLEKCTQGLS